MRCAVSVFAAIVVLAPGFARGKEKNRAWQEGIVVAIQRPGDPLPGQGRGTGGPEINMSPQGASRIVVPERSTFGVRWAIAVDLPDAGYIVTLPVPPSKSSLSKLEPGSRVQCAAEGKTLYFRDEKGREFRARIRDKAKAEEK